MNSKSSFAKGISKLFSIALVFIISISTHASDSKLPLQLDIPEYSISGSFVVRVALDDTNSAPYTIELWRKFEDEAFELVVSADSVNAISQNVRKSGKYHFKAVAVRRNTQGETQVIESETSAVNVKLRYAGLAHAF